MNPPEDDYTTGELARRWKLHDEHHREIEETLSEVAPILRWWEDRQDLRDAFKRFLWTVAGSVVAGAILLVVTRLAS